MTGEVPPSPGERDLSREPLPEVVELVAWPDEVIDRIGFDPRSTYVEFCWLPIIGPTATWLYRRVALWVAAQPEGLEVNLPELACSMGFGEKWARNSPFATAWYRLDRYGLAERLDEATFRIRPVAPPLTRPKVMRLPLSVQRFHYQQLQERRS